MENNAYNYDQQTGKKIEIDPKDTINLKKKVILCPHCGEKHIENGKFATFNHQKHLCLKCNTYFIDTERAVGVDNLEE